MLALKKSIENLEYSRLIDVLYILVNNGSIYSKNSNGIFFDIHELDCFTVEMIEKYIDEVKNNTHFELSTSTLTDISNMRTSVVARQHAHAHPHPHACKRGSNKESPHNYKRACDDLKINLGSEYKPLFDLLSQSSSATHMEKEKSNFAGLIKKYSRKEIRENT